MQNKTDYIALLRKEQASDFGVEFPDFPGCVTAGSTLEEAMRMAVEALELHTEDMKKLPAPSSLDAVMADAHNAGTVAFLVAAPARKTRSVAVKITLEERLLAEVDRVSRQLGESRSGFLANAAKARLRDGHSRNGTAA